MRRVPVACEVDGKPVPDAMDRMAKLFTGATCAFEPKPGILVPAETPESYEAPMRSAPTGEDSMTEVNCRATDNDFKRFEA